MIPQKATILCIYEILKKYSDENHLLTNKQIRDRLKDVYDIDMARKAVCQNIDALVAMGIEISLYEDNYEGYYLIDREFEPAEVRMLADAVAAAAWVSNDASKGIIGKLMKSQSVYQGRLMQKTVYVKPEAKGQTKHLFYNIDSLNLAINQGCKVTAILMSYDYDMKTVEKERLMFNPYATFWADNRYYVLAKNEGEEELIHYPIDRLKNIEMIDQTVDMIFGGINPIQYAEKYVLKTDGAGHFDIEISESLWETSLDTFGEEAIRVLGKNRGQLLLKVKADYDTIMAYVMAHGDECVAIGPERFVDDVKGRVMKLYGKYWRG